MRFNEPIDSTGTPTSPVSVRPGRRSVALAVALVSALASVAALPACGSDADGAEAPSPVPEANLVDLTDEVEADWDAEGRPLVINFWASWCTPCRKEMPAFERVHTALADQVAIVGVTDETELDAARGAAAQAGVTYPLLVDEDQTLLIDLEISGLPATVFVDEDGNVIGRHLGALTEDELLDEIEDRYGITA